MTILGLNCAYHESGACLIKGDRFYVTEEERFNRIKHAKETRIDNPHELPWSAIDFCLDQGSEKLTDVQNVICSINPAARFRNHLFDDQVQPGSWGSEEGERAFRKRLYLIPGMLREQGFGGVFRWMSHERCHAASAYYPSGFEEAAVLSLDGIGETDCIALYHGEGHQLTRLKDYHYPDSLGFLWEKLSRFLGFTEYDPSKVMGMGAYGKADRYRSEFKKIVSRHPFQINNRIACFRLDSFKGLEDLFGIPQRRKNEPVTGEHFDIAAALQETTGQVVLDLLADLSKLTDSKNLCLAGGVALNCVLNRQVFEEGPFDRLWVQPAANDAGTALGAALCFYHKFQGNNSRIEMRDAYTGPAYDDETIEKHLVRQGIPYEKVDDLYERVSELICTGKIVGWFQGPMEFGPRALGNRSLLADPRNIEIKQRLNRIVKAREDFRPFAPSVLAEYADTWFEIGKPTPANQYMLVCYPAKADKRDMIPAVVHVDGTCRVQLVAPESNERFYRLIHSFYRKTGVPMLLNTSFNHQEPIVCSPEDALNTFHEREIDALVMGNQLITRS